MLNTKEDNGRYEALTIIVTANSLVESCQLSGAEDAVFFVADAFNLEGSQRSRNISQRISVAYDVIRYSPQKRIKHLGWLFVRLKEIAIICLCVNVLLHCV